MKPSRGNPINNFLRLIRLPNLLLVALTMILMRYAIIRPILNAMVVEMADNPGEFVPMTLQTRWFDFVILVLSTVFLTAGGYVINDYFDIRTDLINKGSIIVGNTISRRKAMMYHNIFNFLGVVGGFYISWRIGYFWFGVIFILVSGLLYFYSVTYKRQFLVGNIVISGITALIPLVTGLFEATPVYKFYTASAVSFPGVSVIFFWTGAYSLFAFLIYFIKEIVKDMEDFEGDSTFNRRTLPIVAGITTSKIVVGVLSFATLAFLYLIWFFYMKDLPTLIYFTAFILIPFFYLDVKVFKSTSKTSFHTSGSILKFILIAGLLYSVLAGIIFTTGNFTR